MLIEYKHAIIVCHKIGNRYKVTNNVTGDMTKTFAPTAELAINAMKEHLDGENNDN